VATLISPGTAITVTDESFYVSSGPGTVPLVIIATAQDKLTPAGDAIAIGTTKANAGKLWLVASQRELLQTFGTPNFYSVGGNSLHGYSLNEYGLLADHSFLGISNASYVLRADVDTSQLAPRTVPPVANPNPGTFWMNLAKSSFGLYMFDGATDTWNKVPLYVTTEVDSNAKPSGVPSNYNHAVTVGRVEDGNGNFRTENTIYKKFASGWQVMDKTGTDFNAGPGIDIQYSNVYPTLREDNITALSTGDFWINLRELSFDVSYYDSTAGSFVNVLAPTYATGDAAIIGYGSALTAGSTYVNYNYRLDRDTDVLTIYQNPIFIHNGGTVVHTPGSTLTNYGVGKAGISDSTGVPILIDLATLGLTSTSTAQEAADAINAWTGFNTAEITAIVIDNKLVFENSVGNSMVIVNDLADPIGIPDGRYSNWENLVYEASNVQPTGDLEDGTLWYDPSYKVDIMIASAGAWKELAKPAVVSPSAPIGAATGDVWVDTSDTASYPIINVKTATGWRLVDNTDQSSPKGVIFADARPTVPNPFVGSAATVLDADAPDALAYPTGMLLFNTRYSTRNVKRWTVAYTFEGELVGDRWVSESGNAVDGSLVTGDAAVKKIVVKALQAAIANNEDIRSESVFYNLIATPGYPELMDDMVSLNIDRKETAFVLGDTPFHLAANGTDLHNWATNAFNAAETGDEGLITADEYLGIYYPSGFSTNLDGTNVVVPASHMTLRSLAYNDQVAYQWFAPAGLNRGVVSNASSVGYVNAEGEFAAVSLNQGLRDVLYTNNINPIRVIPNSGIVLWGQKTRASAESAMDRINVARLLNFIRYQADILSHGFLFEPNDDITRGNAKSAYDALLSSLVTLRGLYDFLVVCDKSNNTPDRIDRNELWIDIAIQPVKAIEFIYIPIRIKNTGSSLAG
jgi:hypothetical protein